MATDDLGNDGNMNSRMAAWPKWATEQSIKELTAAIAGSNKHLQNLTKQVMDLMKESSGSAKKTAANTVSGKQQGQATNNNQGAKMAGNVSRAQDQFNKRLADSINAGLSSLAAQQSRGNNLLTNINQSLSKLAGSNLGKRAAAGLGQNASSGLGRVGQQQAQVRPRDRAREKFNQDKEQNSKYRSNLFRDPLTMDEPGKYLSDIQKRAKDMIFEASKAMSKMTAKEQQDAAKEITASMRANIGKVIDPALKEFAKEVNAADGNVNKVNAALQKLSAEVEKDYVKWSKKPGEKYSDLWDQAMKESGAMGKEAFSLGGIFKSIGGGLLAMLGGPKSLLGGGLLRLAGTIGLLAGVAKSLFDLWKEGAQQTTKALMRGLDGLTQGGVLSFAIAAKSAGLTLEQFSKALDQAGGMANLLDENVRNTGQAFAKGIKEFLDKAKKENENFGMSVDELSHVYARQIRILAQAGMQGERATRMAQTRANEESDQLRALSQVTGRSVEDLSGAFDDLYKNDMFRIATTRALARGEMDLAKKTESLGKSLAAVGGEMAKNMEDELALASIGGFDPRMMRNFAELSMKAPEIADALERSKDMNEEERATYMSRVAREFLRGPNAAFLAQLAGPGEDAMSRQILGMIRRFADARTDGAARDSNGKLIVTEGQRQAAAAAELERNLQKMHGELLRQIQDKRLMEAMTGLANASNTVMESFLALDETIRDFIGYLGMAAAALFAIGGLGAFGGLGRLGRRAVGGFRRGGGGATPSPGVPPNTPRGGAPSGTGAAASEAAAAAQNAAKGATAAEAANAARSGATAAEAANAARSGATAAEAANAARTAAQQGKITPVGEAPKPAAETPRTTGTPETPKAEAPKPAAETPRTTGTPETPKAEAPKPANENAPRTSAPGEGAPPPGEGTASRFSNAAAAAKTIGKEIKAGGILSAVIGVGINELLDVQDLKKAREEVIKKYQAGEISRKDAQDALKEIDDKIAESRGGSLTRGGLVGVTGTLGAIGAGALGSVVPGAGTVAGGVVGSIVGAEVGDRLLGDTAEKAGGWISRQLFGGSNSASRRELDKLDDAQLPPQLRGKGFKRDGELTDRQVKIIDDLMASGLSMEQIGMPAWLREKYLHKKNTTQSSATQAGNLARYAPAVAKAVEDSVGKTPEERSAMVRQAAMSMTPRELAQLGSMAGPGNDANAKAALDFVMSARNSAPSNVSPTAGQAPGPQPQPGAIRRSSSGLMIAGQPAVQGRELTPDQMTAIGMALTMSPDNAKNYPDWVMTQYNKQKSASSTGPLASAPTDMLAMTAGPGRDQAANDELSRRQGLAQTPSSVTGAGAAVRSTVAGAAPGIGSQESAQQAQERSSVAFQSGTLTNTERMLEMQSRQNQLLATIVEQNGMLTGDTRRQVDLLENINNKT